MRRAGRRHEPAQPVQPGESGCTRCGLCCHFDIPLDLEDIDRIAAFLGEETTDVVARCVQPDPPAGSPRLLLAKQVGGQACIFLTEARLCAIHPARPSVCASYLSHPDLRRANRAASSGT